MRVSWQLFRPCSWQLSRCLLTAVAVPFLIGASMGETFAAFPERPIRFLLSHPPGGSADVVARLMLPKLQESLGQPVVIENRPGAGGNLAMDAVAKAKPDGYTIGLGAAGSLALSVARDDPIAYDPVKDFTPISGISGQPFILAAANALPGANTVQGIIEIGKRGSPRLSLGHGGAVMELVAAMFDQAAGLQAALVPYRGTAPVLNDLLGGHVMLGIVDIPSGKASIDAGLIKPIAISSPERFSGLPDIPTFVEAGLPEISVMGWLGVVAPAAVSPEIAARLDQAFSAALNDPEVLERLQFFGSIKLDVHRDAFRALIENDIRKYRDVLKNLGGRK